MNLFPELFIIGLATARLSLMLTEEDGPWDVFFKLRRLAGIIDGDLGVPDTFLGKLLSCHRCASVWIALGLSLLHYLWTPIFVLYGVLAISMLSVLANTYVNR